MDVVFIIIVLYRKLLILIQDISRCIFLLFSSFLNFRYELHDKWMKTGRYEQERRTEGNLEKLREI